MERRSFREVGRLRMSETSPKNLEQIVECFKSHLGGSLVSVVLFDKNRFFETLTERMRKIISDARITRKRDNGEYYWEWKEPPQRGWEITWNGYREL